MKTLTNILLTVTLGLTVFLCNRQESDLVSLRHWNHMQEGGLDSLHNRIAQLKGGLGSTEGGLDLTDGGLGSANGGLDLLRLRSSSATLRVMQKPRQNGPITVFRGPTRGTGVFVSDNKLLTAKHVVDDRIADETVFVTGPDGVEYRAVEVLEDFNDDLALVIIEGRCGPWLDMGPSPVLGAEVICIGTPFGDEPQLIITWARVSSENWKNKFVYDGFAWGGCSGGPAIVDGKVAGIIIARLNSTASMGFATPLNRLDAELRIRIFQ